MTNRALEVVNIARELPVEDRWSIIDDLLDSVRPDSEEIDRLWATEVERRIDQFDAGKVELIPGEEVFAKIEARYGK